MKKIIISSLVVLLTISTFAQVKGSLTIYAKEGEKIWVIKNGIKQNKEATTSVTIKDITEKYFKIKVIVDDDAMSTVDKSIQMVDVDDKMCDITYELRKKKNVYGLNMISWVPITAQSTTTTTTTTTTSEPKTTEVEGFQQNTTMGETGVTQTTTTGQTQTNVNMGQNGANITINDPEMGVNMNVGVNIPTGEGVVTSSTTTRTTVTTTTSSSSTSGSSGTTKPVTTTGPMKPKPQPKPANPPKEPKAENPTQGCYAAMPTADFNAGKAQVQKASFADDKLRIAKQVTQANCMSVAQIKEIAKLFSYEDNKLEYLKFAYDFTFEKNKYYLVNDLFSFSSSKEEMDEFLNSKK